MTELNELEKLEHVTKLKHTKNCCINENYKFIKKDFFHVVFAFLHRIFAFIFLYPYLKLKYHVKVQGKENLKALKKSGAVVISNHIHLLDINMIAINLFKTRIVKWLTMEKNLSLSVKFLIENSGGIPIPNESAYKPKFFHEINEYLKHNGILHICPEASLIKNYPGVRPFKNGAFIFSVNNNVPILPTIIQIDEIKKSAKSRKYKIIVGKPLYPNLSVNARTAVEELKNKAFSFMNETCTSTIFVRNQQLFPRIDIIKIKRIL